MLRLPVAGGGVLDIRPSKIIAVGLNYRAHVAESGETFDKKLAGLPKEPVLFAKTPNVLTGPGEPIVLPALIGDYRFDEARTDLEAELAIIISKRARHVPEESAFDYVLGYTCFNDVSQRNIQMGDPSGWFRGKSFDTFGPIGPVVVRREDLPDPGNLKIRARLNGELKQEASTADMIFSVPALIAFISKNMTLEEGDIIASGTPSGVSPIKAGDTVEIEIEGIGVLRNPVIGEPV
ncbi:MAG: fumarylacetoacetate hydrolase family protein [Treponema sp.]|jgi:2-keto-4-pentenoate hydratase/2-oxohepta-3-ene-1,7-dioic acid hydratase in catechol pathway|nr:fumarylacetoacetate hydrolase family protein [Treponema sp.]